MGTSSQPGGAFAAMPLVQRHIAMAAEMVGRNSGRRFTEVTLGCLQHVRSLTFDSPLEALFWIWWEALALDYLWLRDEIVLERQTAVTIDGQTFLLDFVVTVGSTFTDYVKLAHLTWPNIAVEVDGHAFHERTPDQVALRDRRDRLLQQAHWKVFHFSWTEFTDAPETCVDEVWGYVSTIYHDFYKQTAMRDRTAAF